MDQAPALIDRRMGQKPIDRALAGMGEKLLYLGHLLGDVDVDGAI
jgi:hypothetical protein